MSDEHKDEHASGGDAHGGGGHGGGGHGGGAHGGGSHEEHEGAPEWLISFADNVALMMGFFVILLAMNMQKPSLGGIGGEGKYPSDEPTDAMKDFAIEMRAAFHSEVDINSTNPHEQELVQRLRDRKKEGGKTRQNGVDGRNNTVPSAPRPSDWVKPYAVAYFLDFDAQLNEEGKTSMAQAAELLKGQRWIVEVRGHVSALEAKDNKERAMRLAHERAYAAASELVAQGMKWEQMRVVACADNERDTPRADSVEGHRNNQSVQVVTTQEPMPGDPFNGPSSNAGSGGTPSLATPVKE
jgi:hypothetical protein